MSRHRSTSNRTRRRRPVGPFVVVLVASLTIGLATPSQAFETRTDAAGLPVLLFDRTETARLAAGSAVLAVFAAKVDFFGHTPVEVIAAGIAILASYATSLPTPTCVLFQVPVFFTIVTDASGAYPKLGARFPIALYDNDPACH